MNKKTVRDHGRLRAFLLLCRPQFLVPGVFLYVLGYLIALGYGAEWDLGRFLSGYLVFFLAHFSLTFSNDFFDREADSHGAPSPISGGSGALSAHPELSRLAISLAVLLIVLSMIAAVWFQLRFGPEWYFLPFVLAGNLLGFFYTAPPVRLAYRGLGEAATMVAAGVIMPGMGYLSATGALDGNFLLLSLPFLAYGIFFIISVELPDVEGDRAGGKRNLLVRYGERSGSMAAMLAVLSSSVLWTVIALLETDAPFDMLPFILFSMVPLTAGTIGMIRIPSDRRASVKQAKLNFLCLMIFLSLAILYLIVVV